jgi:ATP-binding cassette subfamily F protein 3
VNVLVIDEPTNHLDIPSRESLEEALEAYEGTIVTISHDRFFLDRVATQILALDGEGGVEHYNGDYTEYHDWKAGKSEPPAVAGGPDRAEVRPSGNARSKAEERARKKSSASQSSDKAKNTADSSRVKVVKKARDPETIEAEITAFEKRIAELSNDMTKPEIARDITKLVTVNEAYERSEAQLAILMDEWERAETSAGSAKKKVARPR